MPFADKCLLNHRRNALQRSLDFYNEQIAIAEKKRAETLRSMEDLRALELHLESTAPSDAALRALEQYLIYFNIKSSGGE